jgi:hypothetical protein
MVAIRASGGSNECTPVRVSAPVSAAFALRVSPRCNEARPHSNRASAKPMGTLSTS